MSSAEGRVYRMAGSQAVSVRTDGREIAGHRKRKKKKTTRSYIFLVVGFLAIILLIQIIGLYSKEKSLAAQEAALQKQVEEQQEKSEELKNYEEYTKSDEYTENMARSRAGLVKPNEIVFREKKN